MRQWMTVCLLMAPLLAGPAVAGTTVVYSGHITRTVAQRGADFWPSTGQFVARYNHTADGTMEWASLNIAGLPSWRFECPEETDEYGTPCKPLTLTEGEISSGLHWSIEDVADASVQPASAFKSFPWPGGRFSYRVKQDDESFSFVGVSDLFGDCGFCYYQGTGVVDRVTFGFGGVPETSGWALMVAGFGLLGASLRRRRGGLWEKG